MPKSGSDLAASRAIPPCKLCNRHVTTSLDQSEQTHRTRKHRRTWLGRAVHVSRDSGDCSSIVTHNLWHNNTSLALLTHLDFSRCKYSNKSPNHTSPASRATTRVGAIYSNKSTLKISPRIQSYSKINVKQTDLTSLCEIHVLRQLRAAVTCVFVPFLLSLQQLSSRCVTLQLDTDVT